METSSASLSNTQGAQPRRPARLRSVFVVAVVASVVALALALSGAIGLWERSKPVDDTTVGDAAEPSLEALAGQALSGVWDVAAYVRESAARDLTKVTELMRRDEPNELTADGPNVRAGNDRRAHTDTQSAGTAAQTVELTPGSRGPSHPPHVKAPVVTVVLAPPTAGPVVIEPHPVFDGRDVEVTPPRMQRVRLRHASGASSDEGSNEAGLVELIVSASGDVESAKFVTNPLNVHHSMLLSAVKAWRFRPALRNGQAIRYRLRVPISRARI